MGRRGARARVWQIAIARNSRRTYDAGSPGSRVMQHRLVSIVSILAVICCPLWCGGGICCADAECELSDQVPSAADCCCGHGGTEGERRCPEDRRSGAAHCQGICGGAVLEKPHMVRDASQGPVLGAVQATAGTGGRFTDSISRSQAAETRAGRIFGRSLRARQMSWLC